MKSRQDESREYRAFLSQQEISAPPALDIAVRREIRERLSPSFVQVWSKLGISHLAASLVTLSVCPQFQFRLLGEGHGLMGVFMDWFGPVGCTVACAVFFMGTSSVLSSWVLERDEIRELRGRTLPAVLGLLLPSLAFFALVGVMSGTTGLADFLQADTALWTLGALVGGWATLRAGLGMRLRPQAAAN